MKVMIVVTHLLGAGHLSRALTLARAFSAQGHIATVVSGGRSVPHFDRTGVQVVQLPPLQSDGVNFTRLLAADGKTATDEYLKSRQECLSETFALCKPDVLITELYPFGRRSLRGEFLGLLQTAKSMPTPPLILSSIRDILAPPSKPDRARLTEEMVLQFYDAVLVHSDARVTPLDQSWPVTPALQSRLHYTGYVAPASSGPHPDAAGTNEILVSAGAGPVGDALFEAAVAAASLSTDQVWRILVGGANQNDRIERLRNLVRGGSVIVEPTRPDFRQMLYHTACSVSMCGYNTALDLMQSGCPAILVPFDDGGEVEQTLRAQSLARMGGMRMMKAADVTVQTMMNTVADISGKRRPPGAGFQLDGANETVRTVSSLMQERS